MKRSRGWSLSLVVVAVVLVGVACSGRPVVEPPPEDLGVVAGRVIKGNVSGATVTVFRLEGLERGAQVGAATTDADGAFRVPVGTATGPFLVVAAGGAFVDEATGVTAQLNTAELTALVPTFAIATKLESIRVTPVSHLAAGLAQYWVRTEDAELAAADAEAWQRLNLHFGALDWRVATPTDVTTTTGATLDEPTRQGLLLAALSMQARLIAEGAGLTPGGRVNPVTLTAALYDDVTADGFFDGVGATGRLVLPAGGTVTDAGVSAKSLDGQTLRTDFAQGIAKFLATDRNVTAVTLADVQQLVAAISTNDDRRLFREASGPADIEPPVITFVRPAVDNAGVRGVVELEVRAVDAVAVRELVFTAPAALAGAVATPSVDGKSSSLVTTFDVSALPEGPVAVSVRATDTSNNVTMKSLTLQVSNRGPTITVTTPGEGDTINGVIAITASASAESGSIARLELRNAPAGVGVDSLAAAADFATTWNTLFAPEGLVSLTFHAEDTLGGVADKTISVIIDNVPLGTVTTTATLGAPVGGLRVQLVAIDDATGLPVMGRVGGAVLGETAVGTLTDPGTGAVTFTLTQENYDGPAQVVAQGTTASYVDPTDDTGATSIALPTSFTLTSYVRRYRTGDALNVPLTGWTTLADDAVLAYAQGRNPSEPNAGTLGAALTVVEPLFPAHVSRPTSWPLRTVVPVSLVTGTQSMRDVVFAALPDVGLNQLARDTAIDVGLTPGTGYGLPQLLGALRQDVSDGLFDGRAGSLQLVTGGTTPYSLDANTSRFKLAVGMDRFIRSSANATGLTRQDLQTSGIYDNVSGDTSILYPSSVAPIPFDNVAPTITWTVKYANGTHVDVAPVALGTVQLVAGVVSIEALAADSSGVQSVTVSLDGQPMAPAMGSNNTLFKSTFDSRTVSDGTFTATATTCDRLANCGTSTFAFETDNTQPSVSPARPAPGFYSASFDVEALASDNTRLDAFTLAGPAGAAALVDQDAQLNRVYAPSTSWVLGGADGGVVADGPFVITFRACDVVGNCRSVTSSPTIDRTPPNVAFSTPLPLYTNNGSITVVVTATDTGAGLSRVFIKNNGQPPVQAAQGAGTWSATIILANARNDIAIWAEDLASPANSGETRPGFNLTTMVFLDTVAPSPTLANFPAYHAETALNFQRQANGVPVMPVSYIYQSSTKADLSVAATSVVKAASRLSWGPATPTAAELEGANPRNVPFLQFQVPFTVGSESPITSFEYRFTSSEGMTPWRNAIPAARTGTNVRFYDAPIALETLPALATWGSTPRSFTMDIRVGDQAGNTGGGFYQRTVHVVPPPVAIVRDTAYENRGDARSLFNYRLANQSYDEFYDTNNANFSTDPAIRHTRYVVYNPSDAPVAVSARNAASNVNGRTTETWTWQYYVVPGAPGFTYQTPDGLSFRVDPFWDSRPGSQFTTYCGSDPIFTSPCGLGSKSTHYPAHIFGSGSQYTCLPIPLPNEVLVSPPLYSGAGVFRAFRNAVTNPTGVESVAADTVGAGFVVPGATGGNAGTLALYHASPRTPSPRGSAPAGLIWQPNPFDAASKYQFWQGDHFVPTNTDGYSCGPFPERTTEKYSARRRYQQLQGSTTIFNSVGAIFSTSGVTAAAPYTVVGGFSDYDTQTSSITFVH